MPDEGGQLSELFLSIDEFMGRARELAAALADLDMLIEPLATQGFYEPGDDRALIALVVDPRRGGKDAIGRIAQELFRLRIDCFELAALSTPERKHFHSVELPRYTVHVRAADSAQAAVLGLFRTAGGVDDGAANWAQGTPAEAKRTLGGEYSQVRKREAAETPKEPRTKSRDFLVKERADVTADLAAERWIEPSSFDRSGNQPRIARGSRDAETTPPPTRTVSAPARSGLRVRFLRGESWLAGRVRYISNREVRVATGAPLRLGDAAIVGITFAREELFLNGVVSEVEPIDSEPISSPGFTLSFANLDPTKADQLVAMLRRARDAGVSLVPPPVRGAPRFPVSWPVVLRTEDGAERALAHDISWNGVYLDIDAEVGSQILFAIPLDNAGASIRCRGTVVRTVTPKQAIAFQSRPGCGIAITHFGAGDAERYREFLDRVKSRCQRRVIVAASPLRAQGLTRALAAAGYAVSSSTDPNSLADLADSEPRPPDIAVIDESLAGAMEGEMLRALFRRKNVPCLSVASEANDQTRQQVDRMLAVHRRT